MNDQPYIYAGKLNTEELYSWLTQQSHALGALIIHEARQVALNEELAALHMKSNEVIEAAFSRVTQQCSDPTQYSNNPQNQRED
ncbi:Uncharacterised protein [Yersinia aleksiciae]|nr:Uncharacterised protein [Yersinia aleksiciae]